MKLLWMALVLVVSVTVAAAVLMMQITSITNILPRLYLR